MDDGEMSGLLSSKKGAAMLAYLIVHGQTVSRESMTNLLWEVNSTAEGLRNLRVLLTRSRPSLPDVSVTRQALTFTPIEGEQVDYLELRQALKQKEPQNLLKSLQLYRGDLLEGFYLDDAPYFQEWLMIERERLRRTVLDAHRWLCQNLAENQQWERAVEAAVHWLTLDQFDEEALRWLMQFRAASGQIAIALTEYEQFQERFQNELNLELDLRTQTLANKLRATYNQATRSIFVGMDFTTELGWPAHDELAPLGLLPPMALVPFRRNPNFVGRESILIHLAERLLPWPDKLTATLGSVAVLHGFGGVGKTQTAVEFCYRYGRYFPGGVFWINFAEANNVAEEFARLGDERRLGLFRKQDQLGIAEQVAHVQRAWQEPIPRLLIFDNCEEEDLLTEWLPVTGGCRVLVTSRRGVWSPTLALTTVPLVSLALPESIIFLQKLIPHIRSDEAQAIAIEVGNLPLALHLIGSFLHRYRQISPPHYLTQLQDKNLLQHPSLQGRGTNYSPTGHELNVARTYALSISRLDAADPIDTIAQKLLALIACLAPAIPVGRELIRAVVIPEQSPLDTVLLVEDGLDRLIALGFVRAETGERVMMHRLVAAYTCMILNHKAEAEHVVEETIARLLTAVWEKELILRELPFDISHLRYVTDRALKRQDALAASLANYLGRHLTEIQEFAQAEPYLTQALQIRQTLLGEHIDTAVSLTNMGTLFWKWKSNDAAMPYFEEAYQLCERLLGPIHPRTARSLNNLAVLHYRQGHYETAQTNYEKVLNIYEQLGEMDDPMIPQILGNMALMFRLSGQFEQARIYSQRAFQVTEAMFGPEHYQTTITLFRWAIILILKGHYEAAQPALERALLVRKKMPDGEVETISLYIRLGELHMFAGRFAEAESYLEKGLSILKTHSDKDDINWGWAFAKLGQLNLLKGEVSEAEALLQKALSFFKFQPPTYFGTIETFNLLADLYLKTEQLDKAKQIIDEALVVCRKYFSEHHPFTAQVCLRFGEWYLLRGDDEKALGIFEEVAVVLKKAVFPTHLDYIRLQKHLAL